MCGDGKYSLNLYLLSSLERSSIVEKFRQKQHQENSNTVRRRSIQGNPRPQSYKSSSSDHSDTEIYDRNVENILAESRANLDRTEALKRANSQLLRPEDYVRFDTFHSNDIPSQKSEIEKSVRCRHDDESRISRNNHHRVIVNETKNKTKEHVKGFFHYVFFVTSYVMLIFFVTLLITQLR